MTNHSRKAQRTQSNTRKGRNVLTNLRALCGYHFASFAVSYRLNLKASINERRHHRIDQSIPGRIYVFLICGCFLFSSCLKNKDSTANGPKSLVAITNYVVNGSISITLDNTSLTTTPLSFGNSLATASGGYVPVGAGLHNFKLTSGTSAIGDNTIPLATGINYSLFLYDTIKNNAVKALLLKDDLTVAVDTVAKLRFLQFIPESDTLTISFKKDTTTTISDAYVGLKASPATAFAFLVSVVPGSYQVTLTRNGTVIAQSSNSLVAGKLYSFISKGTVNGTGNYKESITMVENN